MYIEKKKTERQTLAKDDPTTAASILRPVKRLGTYETILGSIDADMYIYMYIHTFMICICICVCIVLLDLVGLQFSYIQPLAIKHGVLENPLATLDVPIQTSIYHRIFHCQTMATHRL